MRAGKGGNGGKVNQQQVINQDGKANAGTIVYYATTVDETFRMSPTLSADCAIKHKLIATLIPNCTYICSAQCVFPSTLLAAVQISPATCCEI